MVHDQEAHTHKRKGKEDPYSGITGGLVLILLGVLFILVTTNVLFWSNWWAYFLLGLGFILVLEVLLRTTGGESRQQTKRKLMGGVICIIIGAAYVIGIFSWWPLILVAAGLVLLISSFQKMKVEEEED